MADHRAHLSTRRLFPRRISTLLLSLCFCLVAAGAAMAGETQRHVVGSADIQARIDRQLGQEVADRLEIQRMLGQPGVRQVADAAGLDIERARAAAALLSGAELEDLATSAREINAGIGGDTTFTITATTLIIILLLLILLTK